MKLNKVWVTMGFVRNGSWDMNCTNQREKKCNLQSIMFICLCVFVLVYEILGPILLRFNMNKPKKICELCQKFKLKLKIDKQ